MVIYWDFLFDFLMMWETLAASLPSMTMVEDSQP
jgi:hypothetical protein